jgi:hypothetical protein
MLATAVFNIVEYSLSIAVKTVIEYTRKYISNEETITIIKNHGCAKGLAVSGDFSFLISTLSF